MYISYSVVIRNVDYKYSAILIHYSDEFHTSLHGNDYKQQLIYRVPTQVGIVQ